MHVRLQSQLGTLVGITIQVTLSVSIVCAGVLLKQ